ncbi:hypothetical protein [Winogradskyella sp.]|uniref:hypothetical protein n=1 Tax=Winogradskyella sp. TaxID=1883156 RepID=UPI002622D915|nr:hypothetical protein [Winogradskyella sp.]
MKLQFKTVVLMLITSVLSHGQELSKIEMDEKHTIYKESFATDSNTTLVLNLESTTVKIVDSPDDKVHIEYTMEFNNYRKKRIKEAINRLKISGKKEGNKITYTAESRNMFHRYDRHYYFEDLLIGRLAKKDSMRFEKPKVVRKSLDSIVEEIKQSDFLHRKRMLRAINREPRPVKQKKNTKLIISKMEIMVPSHIHVRATAENSSMYFESDFNNRLTLNSRNSKLKFKSVGNSLNVLDVDNGNFWAQDVTDGSYSFANSRSVTIGKLSNAKINSEFTKVQVGEIGKNVTLVDFNSEYFLYNWTKDFERFELTSEYSKVHLFSPKLDYHFIAFGNNTKSFAGPHQVNMNITKKNEKGKIMERKSKGDSHFSGEIYFDIIHGIIYSYLNE